MGISLCMIVKNEEDCVEGAVQSVRSIVNEVIIVDAGSTDATLERIQALGVKSFKILWKDSFSEARNASLAQATQPWILVLDADERIASKDLPLILDRTSRSAADGYQLIQRNYVFGNQILGWVPNGGDYEEGANYSGYVDNPLIRLFRNSPEIRFDGAVHEIIDPTRLSSRWKFENIPAVIHHYGKVRGEERVQAKQRFYLTLGLKRIEEEPANGKAYFEWIDIFEAMPVRTGHRRWSEPLSLLQKTHDYLRKGNVSAATRVLAALEQSPFLENEVRVVKGQISTWM